MDAGERVHHIPEKARRMTDVSDEAMVGRMKVAAQIIPDLDALADVEASKIKRGPPCWICSIPEREWVEKAKKEGRSLTVIAAVLVRQGHPKDMATRARLEHHLANHVR
jgi:hypothetical protein